MFADYLHESHQIIIERISPEIDGGRYAAKRVLGDKIEVQADIFRDGHDSLKAVLCYHFGSKTSEAQWLETPMSMFNNDRWTANFEASVIGRYTYAIEAWNDRFGSWQKDMAKRVAASEVAISDVLEGVALVEAALTRISISEDNTEAKTLLNQVRQTADPIEAGSLFLTDALTLLLDKYPDRSKATRSPELELIVDPEIARFSAWYELFPRSQSAIVEWSGTFQDCIAQLPRIAGMGFDVIYLPPIHPIGVTNRKGRNNSLVATSADPGSPWAIGNQNGGHKAIEPTLGTFEDFAQLVEAAAKNGIQIALDFAIQCSPDHPYVTEHPDWFFIRPDGTIRYAENPPKKYQDIYPINFYCENRAALWEELRSVMFFWIERGVTIFRVDNPHTKSLAFWEWAITTIKEKYPETLFLAEAFTRPKVMKLLAKAGFSQSYTYFTWRNTKAELTEYLTELTQTEMKEYYRGNLWTNTPDILHEFLQEGGIPAFKLRLILAATLSSTYGIYSGYELGINAPLRKGSEEYLDSDKYQTNIYNWQQPQNFSEFITRLNRIRHENLALQLYDNLTFHRTDNNVNIIAYSKTTPDLANIILVVVNLDPHNPQETNIAVPFWEWGIENHTDPYDVIDLLNGAVYTWYGEYNYVRLDPYYTPAHIFLIKKKAI